MTNTQQLPALLSPRPESVFSWHRPKVPLTRQNLLEVTHLLKHFHDARGPKESLKTTDLVAYLQDQPCCETPTLETLHRLPYLRVENRIYGNQPRLPYIHPYATDACQFLNDVLHGLRTADDYVPYADLFQLIDTLWPSFNRRLPPGFENLKNFFRAFPGTFDTTRKDAVRLLHTFEEPNPEIAIPVSHQYKIHTPEALTDLTTLMTAILNNPEYRKRGYLSITDLHSWLASSQPARPLWDSSATLQTFLQHYEIGGYYTFRDNHLKLPMQHRGTQSNLIETAIRVHAKTDGFASCKDLLPVLKPVLRNLTSKATASNLATYISSHPDGSFIKRGQLHVASASIERDQDNLYRYTACIYYPRYLAKQQVLIDGLAYLSRLQISLHN